MQTTKPNRAPSQPVPAFGLWDLLPDIILPSERAKTVRLAMHMQGKKLLLLLCSDLRSPECRTQLAGYAARFDALDPLVHLFAVTPRSPDENAAALAGGELPFRVLSDIDRQVAAGLGVTHNLDGGPREGAGVMTAMLADANRRVLRIDRDITASDHAETILAYLEAHPNPEPRELGGFAPVLYVPKVFEPEFCRRLIELHETGGSVPTRVYRPAGQGGREGDYVIDPEFKVRRDHLIEDPVVLAEVQRRIARRMLPEVEKAFTRRVTGVEEFKIVCYEAADGGHFSAHRDNLADRHAHRRFAMTLNLNTGAYEGGQLRFPEYGGDLYRPLAGDAVVFSCGLLHEALPVTTGRRFALLSFMFDAESRKRR